MTKHKNAYDRPANRGVVWCARLLFGAAILLVTYVSLLEAGAPSGHLYLDKVLHAGAYAVLTGLFLFAAPRLPLRGVFAFPFIWSGILEILQGTMATGRTASLADLVANGVGGFVVILVWLGFCKVFRAHLA